MEHPRFTCIRTFEMLRTTIRHQPLAFTEKLLINEPATFNSMASMVSHRKVLHSHNNRSRSGLEGYPYP